MHHCGTKTHQLVNAAHFEAMPDSCGCSESGFKGIDFDGILRAIDPAAFGNLRLTASMRDPARNGLLAETNNLRLSSLPNSARSGLLRPHPNLTMA